MHVGAKKLATAGLLVAFTVIMMILSSVIETNSLFLMAAASFCVGIAIREWGLKFGFGFWVASILLNVFIAPNKMYCITYGGMGLYLFLSELLWEKLARSSKIQKRTLILWIGKYLVFNLIYIPILLFFPSLILEEKLVGYLSVILFVAGQIAIFLYDMAYRYFQAKIWGGLRIRLGFKEIL